MPSFRDICALIVIPMLPTPANLPVAGHRMLAILAAAMSATGLDRRIALTVLSRVGIKTNHVVVGTIAAFGSS